MAVLNDPALTATVVCNGKVYPAWESAEVSGEFGVPVSYMRFVAVEDENNDPNYAVNLGDAARGLGPVEKPPA
jgi:hypothetical protein